MQSSERVSLPSSHSEAWLLPALVRLLESVEALPSGATGSLNFGEHGAILVHEKRICWAVSRDMRVRLLDLLDHASAARIPRQELRSVYRTCKDEGRRFTETLMAEGLVSESGLREALFRHHADALVQLARSELTATAFVPARTGYDLRFTFSTAELLAGCGAVLAPELAARASEALAELLVPDTTGAAFVRDATAVQAHVLAVAPGSPISLSLLFELASRSISLFDVIDTFDRSVRVLRAVCCEQSALVAWRDAGIYYVALCASRAATARLMSSLRERVEADDDLASTQIMRREGVAR